MQNPPALGLVPFEDHGYCTPKRTYKAILRLATARAAHPHPSPPPSRGREHDIGMTSPPRPPASRHQRFVEVVQDLGEALAEQ
jgi:hypothetical protein